MTHLPVCLRISDAHATDLWASVAPRAALTAETWRCVDAAHPREAGVELAL